MLKSLTNFNRFSTPIHEAEQNQMANILTHLKNCGNLKQLECIYALMIKNSTNQDCFLMNQFITACSNFRCTDYAIQAFTHVKNPNVFVYNAVIKGLVHCFYPNQALQFYMDMLRAQISPSSYTFSSIIKGCKSIFDLGFGESVHGQIWKIGFRSHLHVQTALVDFYSSLGRILEARQMFDEMPERDVFAWTTMVSSHAQVGDLNTARQLFNEMPDRNIATWNAMIGGYSRLGDVESAEILFCEMPEKDLISWTTMITCYSQKKMHREALLVFNEMKKNRVNPDEVTMATVISSCAHLGLLDLGKEIHFYILQNKFNLDVYIGSALIDMYAKCGSIERSLLVFFKLQEKNLFCWNSVIDGLALHGYANEALAMFNKMENLNIKPNAITFINVLSACTHAGFVNEGRRIFQKMMHDYSLEPNIEHFGCMVDLYCKAGFLDDALTLIRTMKMEPNSVIWGALLCGCKLHKNIEIGQLAVKNLIVLEPNNTGYYTLLINMYAESNKWSEVSKIRAIMKEQGIEKNCPGSSWIEMNGKFHQFAASDESHFSANEIYSALNLLCLELSLADIVFDYEITPQV